MIVFWIFATFMLLIPIVVLAPAILGKSKRRDQDRQQQNVAIAQEQLRLLESEKANETVTDTEYQQTRLEIESALYHDVVDNKTDSAATDPLSTKAKVLWFLILLAIPVVSIPLYQHLGNPHLVEVAQVPDARQMSQAAPKKFDLVLAAEKLEQKLKQTPDDGKGWYLLGQTYMALKDYPNAVGAFANSYKILKDDPRLMLRYADAVAMTQKGRLQGLPFELVSKAIKLVPTDPTALWLLGIAYAERGDFKQALHYWELLLPLLTSDPTSEQEVEKLIIMAKQNLGQKVAPAITTASNEVSSSSSAANTAAATNNPSVRLQISISPELAKMVSPDDSVFIFARAMNGPRIPLAAIRKQVRDLPVSVVLDDSQAMRPQFRLSQYPQVMVGARISKSGNPIASMGDFYGEHKDITPADHPELTLEINKIVK